MFFNKSKYFRRFLRQNPVKQVNRSQFLMTATFALLASAYTFDKRYQLSFNQTTFSYCEENAENQGHSLPIYRKSDLQKHKTFENRIWVAYKDSVYDVTDFIKVHPGGTEKILLGSGQNLESFFSFYPFHKKELVQSILSKYKIGHLHPDDQIKETNVPSFSSQQQHEEQISENLQVLQSYPMVAETKSSVLSSNFITQNRDFFIRNHSQIPLKVDLDSFKLKVFEGKDKKLKKYTLEDLRTKFQPHSVMSTISCAGNRRRGMKEKFPEVQGNNWNIGGIGNAKYTGVSVIDLLKDLGYDLEKLRDKHLIVSSMDVDVVGKPFEISVPINMIIDPENEIILAYDMNGEELPQDHGFPLRLIVPGVVGVRNAKWVQTFRISDTEATSTQQKENYKVIKEKDPSKIDYSQIPPIFGYIVNSAIASPLDKELIELEPQNPFVFINGWATGNLAKGIPVEKVEVSFDDGNNWIKADIVEREQKEKGKKVFSWVLWSTLVECKNQGNGEGKVRVMVRSTAQDGATQDKTLEEINNIKGLLNNAIHTIEFTYRFKQTQ